MLLVFVKKTRMSVNNNHITVHFNFANNDNTERGWSTQRTKLTNVVCMLSSAIKKAQTCILEKHSISA